MLSIERHEQILQILMEKKSVTVGELFQKPCLSATLRFAGIFPQIGKGRADQAEPRRGGAL